MTTNQRELEQLLGESRKRGYVRRAELEAALRHAGRQPTRNAGGTRGTSCGMAAGACRAERTGIVAARARAVFSIVLFRLSYRLRNGIMHSRAGARVNLYTF